MHKDRSEKQKNNNKRARPIKIISHNNIKHFVIIYEVPRTYLLHTHYHILSHY